MRIGRGYTGQASRLAFCTALLQACLWSVAAIADTNAITLWPNGAPGSENWDQIEVETNDFLPHRLVRNVVKPTLLPFLADPAENTGIAVIVAPGGGFKFLSIDTEGTQVAEWLRRHGVNAFVLKYRLDKTAAHPTLFKLQVGWLFLLAAISRSNDYPEEPGSAVQSMAIEDALASVDYVRKHADQWQIREDAIGVLGFSAGGTVATGTAMRGRDAKRPDFVGSIYGVPDATGVPENAPPIFVLATEDDPVVPMLWAETLHKRWRAAGYPSTLVSYPDGGHGFGMQQKGMSSDGWIEEFYRWLLRTAGQ